MSVPSRPTVNLCSKCGHEMPELSPELASLARSSGGVVLAHEVCPTEEKQAPAGRLFEVRCQIVELTDITTDDDPRGDEGDVVVEELISFKADLRAATLDLAMRPLAEKLGEKWQRAEKNANVADGLSYEVKA